MTVQWLPHVSVERVGDEILVLDSSSGIVHRFPRDFSDIVDSLSTGRSVSQHHPQLKALGDAKLITSIGSMSLSRRSVALGGAGAMTGAVITSAFLPVSALASSHTITPPNESSDTFTLPNDLFFWFGSLPFAVFSGSGLARFGVFELGDPWTISVRRIQTFTAETEVTELDGELVLFFSFEIPGPDSIVPFEGQLSGPNGLISNPFLVSPAPI